MKQNWWIIPLVIIALLFYFDPMHRFDPEQTIIKSDTIIYNPPDITVSVPAGKPSIITVNVPQSVDTSKIIQEYFTTLQYNDSVETDSVKIHIMETVSQNRILARSLTTSLKFPCKTIITNVQDKQRNKIYLGGTVNFDSRPSLAVFCVAVNKRDQLLMASYDPLSKRIEAGVGFKIKLHR